MTTAPASGSRHDRLMLRAVLGSVALHGLVCLWLWRAPAIAPSLAPVTLTVPIDLVSVAASSERPAAERPAALPQQKAPEAAARPDPRAIPPPAIGKASDPLAAKLRQLAQLQQPAPLPPAPSPQDGAGQSNVTAAAHAGSGVAAYGIRDYVRAQIERRWMVPAEALRRNDWVVRIRLIFGESGRIERVEIIDDERLIKDPAFRDFAFSVRNAALLSSPIALPGGGDALPAEMLLDFNPRRVQQ